MPNLFSYFSHKSVVFSFISMLLSNGALDLNLKLFRSLTFSCFHIDCSSTEGNAIGSVNKVTQVDAIQTHKSTISPSPMVVNEQRGNKSVRFDCDSDASSISSKGSSSETGGENRKQYASAGNHQVSKRSPYPTPLKLSDDIQTPGTVFPAYLENVENGRNPRIRSQYVYPVQIPVENISQWNVVKEKDSDNIMESLEQKGKEPSKLEEGKRENSGEEVLKVDESLSSWLKPRPSNEKGNSHSGSGENAGFGKSHEDRPILGMVAAHWNEAEPTHVSPKWWDGNGIPNSTTKYKEVCIILRFCLFLLTIT